MWNVKRVNDLIVISKTGKQLNLKIYIKLKTKKNEKNNQSFAFAFMSRSNFENLQYQQKVLIQKTTETNISFSLLLGLGLKLDKQVGAYPVVLYGQMWEQCIAGKSKIRLFLYCIVRRDIRNEMKWNW